MIRCRLLSPDEFRANEKARHAAVAGWRAEHPEVDTSHGWPPELRALSESFRPPGTMWFCPWYHDPKDPEDMARLPERRARAAAAGYEGHLSIHYFKDWAEIRPPICVVGPNGCDWIVDAKSSNGSGWTVTGEAPDLVVSPSIWLRQGEPNGYHGYLGQNGAPPGYFSPPV